MCVREACYPPCLSTRGACYGNHYVGLVEQSFLQHSIFISFTTPFYNLFSPLPLLIHSFRLLQLKKRLFFPESCSIAVAWAYMRERERGSAGRDMLSYQSWVQSSVSRHGHILTCGILCNAYDTHLVARGDGEATCDRSMVSSSLQLQHDV